MPAGELINCMSDISLTLDLTTFHNSSLVASDPNHPFHRVVGREMPEGDIDGTANANTNAGLGPLMPVADSADNRIHC